MKLLPALGLMLTLGTAPAIAAPCSNTSAGFDAWKADFARLAIRNGVGQTGLDALAKARYSTGTIAADRNQKSFKYSLEKFMQVRGAATIVSQGRKRLARDRAFYDALERIYGVPGGVLIALHGMETGFGGFMGDTPVVSAIVTLRFLHATRSVRACAGGSRIYQWRNQRRKAWRVGTHPISTRQRPALRGGFGPQRTH
jgi:membrane-bound lytic murein transglycosylase B